jgi:hypothetical protein
MKVLFHFRPSELILITVSGRQTPPTVRSVSRYGSTRVRFLLRVQHLSLTVLRDVREETTTAIAVLRTETVVVTVVVTSEETMRRARDNVNA